MIAPGLHHLDARIVIDDGRDPVVRRDLQEVRIELLVLRNVDRRAAV